MRLQAIYVALALVAAADRSAWAGTIGEFRLLLSPQTEAPGGITHAQAEVYGRIRSITGSRLTLQTRKGDLLEVDTTTAVQAQRCVPLVVGHAIDVRGTYDPKRVLQANIILRAKDSPASWPAEK